ncbi:MAG: hypothetical protein ACI8RD_005844 [Bacillariaceae sp.]|jgi:hypothetical protein
MLEFCEINFCRKKLQVKLYKIRGQISSFLVRLFLRFRSLVIKQRRNGIFSHHFSAKLKRVTDSRQ